MKQQHTYEKMIREKLNRLPAPDVAGLWDSMEAILDKEMPRREEKKRRLLYWGFNTHILIAASLLLVAGGTLTVNKLISNETTSLKTNTAVVNQTTKPTLTTNVIDENKATSNVLSANENHPLVNESNRSNALTTTFQQSNNSTKTASSNNFATTVNINNNTNVVDTRNSNVVNNNETVDNNASSINNDFSSETRPSVKALGTLINVVNPQAQTLNASDFTIGYPKKKKVTRISDKGFAFGAEVNFPLAIGGRKNDLDLNGKKNSFQDYLPAVYTQYHISKKLFVQAAWQPVSPQYTPNFTLYNRMYFADPLNPDEKDEKIVRLNKLFYSSLPVSVHYSLPKNVTIGVGVQYSKLKKIILQDEEYHYTWSVPVSRQWGKEEMKNEVVVKDPNDMQKSTTGVADSVARSFQKEDIRLLADVNYTYKGLSLGLRYTQGLNNYVNTNFTGLPVKDKNQSLQLYLRYNIFDTRKK